MPAFTMAAPSKPPIMAWDELEGSPKNQVKRFHMTAASKAQKITVNVTMLWSIIPAPIVFATCVPVKAPTNSKVAA